MKLAAINDDSDLLRAALAGLLPGPVLGRVVAASRAAPHPTWPGAVPNGLIDESLLGNIMYGGLMRARAALSGLPPGIAKSPRVRDIIAKAEQLPGNLLDNDSWWLGLVGVFRELFTNPATRQPIKPYPEIAKAIKDKVAEEVRQWVQYTQERQRNQEEWRQSGRDLLARGGVLGQLSELQKACAAFKRIQRQLARQQGALTMPKTEAALVLAGIAGLPIAEAMAAEGEATPGWLFNAARRGLQALRRPYDRGQLQSVGGRFLDMFNPHRRAALGQDFVRRSQNKLIAALAVKAAYDLARDVAERLRANQGGLVAAEPMSPRGQTTQLAANAGGVPTRKTHSPHGGVNRVTQAG